MRRNVVRRAAVAVVAVSLPYLAGLTGADSVSAGDGKDVSLTAWSCDVLDPGDVDEDGILEEADETEDNDAALDGFLSDALGAGHSVSDYTTKWTARLKGAETIGGLTLDAFLNRPDSTLAGLPQAIQDEGYHSLATEMKGCLVNRLYGVLDAADTGFPNPQLSEDAAKGVIFGFVFDNSWINTFKSNEAPGDTAVDTPAAPVDVLDTLLAALNLPSAPVGLPVPALPNPVPLVLKTVSELQANLLNTVNLLFTNLGSLLTQLQIPITLPAISLPAIDLAQLINMLRRIIDSTTYRVCWMSEKTGGATRCGPVGVLPGLDLPVPLGTIVPIDLAGDARPDVTAQLVALPGPNSVNAQWTVSKILPALSGVTAPIKAHVWAIFSVPTGDMQLSVGSDGSATGLANQSLAKFVLPDIVKAVGGETIIDATIRHTNPTAKSGLSFSVAPTTRDAGNLGLASSSTFDAGTLTFSPVPASTGGLSPVYKDIKARLTLKSGDLDGDTKVDSRVGVNLTMPQTGVVLDAKIVSKSPPAGTAECCPFRELTTTVNAIPTTVNVNVDSFPSKRVTDATYDADSNIGQVDFAMRNFPDVDGDTPTGADANTFSKVTAKVQQIPTHVHVNYTAPNPATAAKTHVVHYDANAPIPHAEFTSEEWAHDAAANASAKQRRLSFKADTIPSVIDLTATTTEVSTRNSTGHITYQANGNVTNVEVDNEDVIGLSRLFATVASLPKAIDVSYDTESPADTNPFKFGFEDPGHTIVHVDGRNALADAAGSAPFGVMNVKFRSRVSDFLVPAAEIAPEEHVIVNMDPRAANTPLDDTTQVDLRYSGLRLLDAEVLENGRVAATIRNDAEKLFLAQVNKPDQRLNARIDKLPKQVSFVKELVGGSEDHNKITYTGCTPSGSTCTPKTIDSVKVRLDGVVPASSLPPAPNPACPPPANPEARPALTQGEFVDATITSVPATVTLDLDMPQCGKKTLAYDASTSTGKITAAIRKGAGDLGTVDVAAEVTTIPAHFDASFGEGVPITFAAGPGQTVGEVKAVVSNTGQALVPATFAPHAAATYIETPNQLPQLQASVGLKNLQAFSFDGGSDTGNFTGSIQTKDVLPAANPNSPFTLSADVRTLATDAAGNKVNDLNKATVMKTTGGGAVLTPLPTKIVISKTGGVQADGSDTSTLTIDTTGSAEKAQFFADIAIGGPDGVADALAEALPAVQGVHVGDGSATGEADAIRLVLSLAQTPTKSIVRYGQITLKTAMPASPQPAFDINGFGTLPNNTMNIALDLDDAPVLGDRMHATVALGGITPALQFLKFFPLAVVDNPQPNNPAFDSFLNIEVRVQSGANAGALDLDMRLGEHAVHGANRPDTRVVVHTDSVPAGTKFGMRIGEAAAPDVAAFSTEFRNAAGALTGTPGHTTVQLQMPAEDDKNLSQNPASKVSLDLKDVPSKIDFVVKTAASVKKGNPNETCGLKESDFVLPTLVYTSSGTNQNSLDLTAEINTALFEDDPAKKATAAIIKMELLNLANGFTITNTDEGGTFNLESPNAATGSVIVKIVPFDITLLDLDWTGCPDSTDFISWKADGRATVAIKPQHLRLAITGLTDVELKPGFSTGVSGSFTTVGLELPSPMFTVKFQQNFFGGIKVRLSEDIQGTIPVLSAPNGSIIFPLPVVFHVAKHEAGPWFDINTGIPCGIPPFFVHAVANIEPHRVALSLNSFTVTGGTWTITADPFGTSAGLSILFGGIDIIDTIAGLFTSPYDHGVRAPSVECQLF